MWSTKNSLLRLIGAMPALNQDLLQTHAAYVVRPGWEANASAVPQWLAVRVRIAHRVSRTPSIK